MHSEGVETESRVLVLQTTDDAGDTCWQAVVLYAEGSLSVQRYATGPAVRQRFGVDEYEQARDLSVAESDRVRVLLEVGDTEDLLAVIGERFGTTQAFGAFLDRAGIDGSESTMTR